MQTECHCPPHVIKKCSDSTGSKVDSGSGDRQPDANILCFTGLTNAIVGRCSTYFLRRLTRSLMMTRSMAAAAAAMAAVAP
jgi:hypothetical protein